MPVLHACMKNVKKCFLWIYILYEGIHWASSLKEVEMRDTAEILPQDNRRCIISTIKAWGKQLYFNVCLRGFVWVDTLKEVEMKDIADRNEKYRHRTAGDAFAK